MIAACPYLRYLSRLNFNTGKGTCVRSASRCWLDVVSQPGWRARYLKEGTLRFRQEIYDEQGKLVEVHEKSPS